jgi:hypothetical protein
MSAIYAMFQCKITHTCEYQNIIRPRYANVGDWVNPCTGRKQFRHIGIIHGSDDENLGRQGSMMIGAGLSPVLPRVYQSSMIGWCCHVLSHLTEDLANQHALCFLP